MTNIKPTQATERILSLDILRGVAILGILIMNIISFSGIFPGYMNPMATGELTGIDEIAFMISQLFANQKFISIFSILFGAGIILMAERMESKGKSPATRHYVRNFWLLLIGLFHAYVIWHGDILVQYALCSIWVYLFRKKSVKTLLIWGGIFWFISILFALSAGLSMPYWEANEVAELCKGWQPSAEAIAAETAAFTGSWAEQFPVRAEQAFMLETFIMVWGLGWQVTGLMLIGMALFKSKVLSAVRTTNFYQRMAAIGIGLGLLFSIIGLQQNYAHGWACEYSFFLGSQYTYLSSLPMALGYIALVMLLCKGSLFETLNKWLTPVGRMALTNYLMQSVIATFIFYGHGLGLFGTVGRAEQWLYILGIWAFQIVFSKWWLSKFKFGPMEWLWRSLTYWRLQDFKK